MQKPRDNKTAGKVLHPLPGIGNLFIRFLDVFFNRIGTALVISLIIFAWMMVTVVLGLLAIAVFSVIASIIMFILFGVLVYLEVYAVTAVAMAIIYTESGYKECMERAKEYITHFTWVAVLTTLCIMGGLSLFVVPGIIFAVWFSFGLYVLLREDIAGADALMRSRFYVQGYFWPVFLRLLIVGILCLMINVVPLIGQFVSYYALMIFGYFIYEDLASAKKSEKYEPPGMGIVLGVSLAGILLIIVTVTAMVKSGGFEKLVFSKGVQKQLVAQMKAQGELTPDARESYIQIVMQNEKLSDKHKMEILENVNVTPEEFDRLNEKYSPEEEEDTSGIYSKIIADVRALKNEAVEKGLPGMKKEEAGEKPAQEAEEEETRRVKFTMHRPQVDEKEEAEKKKIIEKKKIVRNYIIGKVTNASKEPIAKAQIRIYEDKKLIKKGLCNSQGIFKAKLPAGKYLVRISGKGYKSRVKKAEVTGEDKTLMAVVLKTAEPELKAAPEEKK